MALPRLRSMTADLREGATDGRYRKVAPDRGGVVESSFLEKRADLDDVWYGIHEKNPKVIPGLCETAPTPNWLPTKEPDSTKW